MRRYNSLNSSNDGDGIDITDDPFTAAEETTPFSEVQFEDGRKHKKTLCLVFVLFFGGLCTLLTSSLILLGHLDNKVYADRLIPLIILGGIMFIPGAYYARIAFYSWKGRRGFSYEQIPSCY